ncbi:hypothetical protein GWN15_22815 [candidate division KSB1 bacterium]|nr:hypothetical protein [candidate division KSB1 bacterium]
MASGQPNFVWVGLFLTLLMGAVFILNQIMDRHTDDKNKKLFLIAHGHISPKAAYLEAAMLTIPGIALAFNYSMEIGSLFLGILIVTGVVYSVKPFSWKDKPILGLVANVLGALLIFSTGWLIRGSIDKELLIHAVPYVCAVTAVYLYTTLPDVSGDAAGQKVTFGVKFGFKPTVYAGFFLDLVALVTAYMLNDEVIFYPAFFSILFFGWAAVRMRMEDVLRAVKFPILILALVVTIKYKIETGSLLFFYILAGVYFFSKIYYKLRFGIDYPNLSA